MEAESEEAAESEVIKHKPSKKKRKSHSVSPKSNHWKSCNEEEENKTRSKTSRSSSSVTVEDITKAVDDGYEADVDGLLPDEVEEPETDAESTRDHQVHGSERRDDRLIEDFRKLRCDSNNQMMLQLPASRHYSSWSTRQSQKRTHSEDSLTGTDEELSAANSDPISGFHRRTNKRKRWFDAGSKDLRVVHSDEYDHFEFMDLDGETSFNGIEKIQESDEHRAVGSEVLDDRG